MVDPNDSGSVSPQQSAPDRIRYLPDWEVPLHPPKRRRRGSDSVFSRLLRAPTALTIPSPTFSIPESFKKHQTTRLTGRSSRGSTPINKNAISAPFGFVHNATGTPPALASMSRLEEGMTIGSPTGTGTLLPMHNAGPRYIANPNALSSHTITTLATSAPGTPLQGPQTYQHEHCQDSPNGSDIPRAERSLRRSVLSPASFFPRLRNQHSSTENSLLPTSPPPNEESQNPNTPPHGHRRFHSPTSLGFIRSSPKNANRNRGGFRNKPLPPPPPPSQGNPINAESGHGDGYGDHGPRGSEKPPFPMNLPPHRRKMLIFIIPLATILLLALILGLGLGLGLRNRFDDTNRLSQEGGAGGEGIDSGGYGNAGAGNDTSSISVSPTPSTMSVSSTSTSSFDPLSSTSSTLTFTSDMSPIHTTSIPPPVSVPTQVPSDPMNLDPSYNPNPNPNPKPTSSSPAPIDAPIEISPEPSSPGALPSLTPPKSNDPNAPNIPPDEPTTPPTTIYPIPDPDSSPNDPGSIPLPIPPPPANPQTPTKTVPQPPSPTYGTLPESSSLPLPPPMSANPGPFSGEFLLYNASGVGACGFPNNENELVAAIAWEVFDTAMTISGNGCMTAADAGGGGGGGGGLGDGGAGSFQGGPGSGCDGGGTLSGNPNENILCGLRLIVRLDRGDEQGPEEPGIIVRVVDRCTSCGPTDLGLSPGVFKALGDEQALQDGRAKGVWKWVQ